METAVVLAILAGCVSIATLFLTKCNCIFVDDGTDHRFEFSLSEPPSDSESE